ncbi:MAG: nucleotide exchange factor GrpE [Bacteroidales bacterium]|jgi:molecular chaperone GrpE
MVKKKSHEERPDEPVSPNESIENQINTESGATDDSVTAEEPKPPEGSGTAEELTRKLTEMQDKYIRLSAEFDNYRKRTLREKIELSKTGGESVIISLLPVVDDFDRAVISMRDTENCEAIRQGLELINAKLSAFLKQNGVSEIEAIHEQFNPDIHEAVTSIAVDNESLRGKVTEVIRKGYTLNEKVIRFPKVVVGE